MIENDNVPILVVDDNSKNLMALEDILEAPGRTIVTAGSGQKALVLMLEQEFAVVLIEVNKPEMNGFKTAEQIRKLKKTKDIPIILMTDHGLNNALIFKDDDSGAVDYLAKPLDHHILRSKVQVFIDMYLQKHLSKRTTEKLKQTVIDLKEANRKIAAQQKSVIEEERLKIMLQMAGSTAHELNQPLALLLGHLELMNLEKDQPDRMTHHMEMLNKAGKRISELVKKIMNIRPAKVSLTENISTPTFSDHGVRLLYVEDTEQDFLSVFNIIKDWQWIHLTRANSLKEASELLEHNIFDLIFLDFHLPDGTGIDFLANLMKEKNQIPVVFITGQGNEMIASRAIQEGASDYLPIHSLKAKTLSRSIKNTLEKFRLTREVEQTRQKIAQMSIIDGLTNIYNRRYMNDIFHREFSRAKRYFQDLACLLIDLDNFKDINDTLGHLLGDHVLKDFASHLKNNVRDSDLCFRYGGEEFLVLLINTGIEGALMTAEKMRKFFENHTYKDKDHMATVTVSIGVASLIQHKPKSSEEMIAYADKALYRAKANGRNRVQIFEHTPMGSLEDLESSDIKNISFLKERISSVLEKTKKASMASLELITQELGSAEFKTHNQLVVQQIELMGKKLQLSSEIIETFKRASVLHDCLKTLLPKSLLNKKGELNKNEETQIEDHPYMLVELSNAFDFFSNERILLRSHHECFDGTGYPERLKGSEIPIGARIFGLVDAYAAMISSRPYREDLTDEQVLHELVSNAGTQFDPALVATLLEIIKENKLIDLPKASIDKAKQTVAEKINSKAT